MYPLEVQYLIEELWSHDGHYLLAKLLVSETRNKIYSEFVIPPVAIFSPEQAMMETPPVSFFSVHHDNV